MPAPLASEARERDQAGTHAPRHMLSRGSGRDYARRRKETRAGDCTGSVALTVSTHLALDAHNCWVQEMVRAFHFGWYDRFVTKRLPLLKGEITVPDGAGLGLRLQPDVAKRPGASVRRTTAMDLQ